MERVDSRDGGICSEGDCDGTMRLKHGTYGSFYGCSNYPDCRHTEPDPNNLAGNTKRNNNRIRGKNKNGIDRLEDAVSHESRIKILEELVSNMAERIESLEFYLDNSEVLGE